MPGKLYLNDIRLSRAYTEGFEAGDGASNPHPSGTPESDAWEAGYQQCCPSDIGCDYFGNAEHTGNWWCTDGPGAP